MLWHSILGHYDNVSTDQFECWVKGRLPHTRGKEDPELMYSSSTICVDHASNYISVHHQVTLGGMDMVHTQWDMLHTATGRLHR